MNRLKVLLALLLLVSFNMTAQNLKKEKMKYTKTELKAKVTKTAKKEAKRLKKAGWVISPGALPLEKQLDRSYMYELDIDEEMNPNYVMGEGQSIGENYDAAKMQAMELARQQIAGKIESETTTLIDNLVGNKQLSAEEAATVTTLLSEGKTIFSQKIGRILPAVECYRTVKNNNKEVLVRLAVKESSIRDVVKGYLRDEMEKKGAKMSDQLDKILSSDK